MPLRVFIGGEYSGRVRDAFLARGHDAMSCDFLPSEAAGPHYQGDMMDVIDDGWDLAIFHPTCRYLANSGAKHLYKGMKKENGINHDRWAKMEAAALFFRKLLHYRKIKRICVENPIIHGHAKKIIGRQQTQTIQPWMHGHMETKATCLWLNGLMPLRETDNVYDAMMKLTRAERSRVHFMAPGEDREKDRSLTLQGIADAYADQWG